MQDRHDFAHRAVIDWETTLPSLDAPAHQLSAAIRLSRLASLQSRIDYQALRQFERQGLRGSEDFRALALLRRAPDLGMTNGQLVDALGGSKAGMSSRLDRFNEHGLTERIPSTVDRRSHKNVLTDQGRELADLAVATVVKARQTMFSDLSDDQVKTFAETLATIIETVDPHD